MPFRALDSDVQAFLERWHAFWVQKCDMRAKHWGQIYSKIGLGNRCCCSACSVSIWPGWARYCGLETGCVVCTLIINESPMAMSGFVAFSPELSGLNAAAPILACWRAAICHNSINGTTWLMFNPDFVASVLLHPPSRHHAACKLDFMLPVKLNP